MANRPEGLLPALTAAGWDSIDWRRHEEEVRRLRSRIFKAVREGDWPKVRNLQKLMLRSWSNTLAPMPSGLLLWRGSVRCFLSRQGGTQPDGSRRTHLAALAAADHRPDRAGRPDPHVPARGGGSGGARGRSG